MLVFVLTDALQDRSPPKSIVAARLRESGPHRELHRDLNPHLGRDDGAASAGRLIPPSRYHLVHRQTLAQWPAFPLEPHVVQGVDNVRQPLFRYGVAFLQGRDLEARADFTLGATLTSRGGGGQEPEQDGDSPVSTHEATYAGKPRSLHVPGTTSTAGATSPASAESHWRAPRALFPRP